MYLIHNTCNHAFTLAICVLLAVVVIVVAVVTGIICFLKKKEIASLFTRIRCVFKGTGTRDYDTNTGEQPDHRDYGTSTKEQPDHLPEETTGVDIAEESENRRKSTNSKWMRCTCLNVI